MPQEVNSTYVALILKSNNPQSVKDFRLISLYNVVYKLISKALTNRIKKVLPDLILTRKVPLFMEDKSLTMRS